MRQIQALGLALTLIGAVGLMLPPATSEARVGSHAVVVSSGGELRLLAAGDRSTEAVERGSARTLACAAVLRLAALDIGFGCGALPALDRIGVDAPGRLAHAQGL
jgi:hypothetical protein